MNTMTNSLRVVAAASLMAVAAGAQPATNNRATAGHLSYWAQGTSPQEIGQRVASRFLQSPHPNFGFPEPPPCITYPEVCAWYGALTFAGATGDPALKAQLVKRFEPLFNEEKYLVPLPDHVDRTVFAALPLELYLQTKDRRYLALGQEMADKQWGPPFGAYATAESTNYHRQGFTWQTRLWVDDAFMITAVQAQAYRATAQRRYIDRAAREMVLHLDKLQEPNGLFFHSPDAPFFWGRGNGWIAAGLSDLLRALPADNPDRPRIMKGYQTMMAALLQYQAASGMWRQLIDDPEAWPETSCTGMFAFAFISGVKEGWLDEKIYGPAARKSWLALITYLNADGDIREVCQRTAKKNSRDHYLNRKRMTGDMHGQAPVLWCATALLR